MNINEDFKNILQPIQLGKVVCRNRILMAAHSYGYADEIGLPTQFLVNYLVERVKGGVGLVIMGGTAISTQAEGPGFGITRNLNNEIIPWYKIISEEVHKYGGVIFDQIMHAGGSLKGREGVEILAPSSIPHERTRGIPVEATTDQIKQIENDFVNAAKRAKLGGLDGIELKCDQGYLIHQFLSPHFNRRTDKYGGNLENRLRFLKDLIRSIRGEVGKEFVVGIRITADSLSTGDLTFEDTIGIVKNLERSGGIDYIHVNGATNSSYIGYLRNHGDSSIESMNFAKYAKRIKEIVKLPVIAASMILHPLEAEYLVASGMADMVAMTRAHIADPEIVNKTKEGRIEDIRPCVLCNQGCVGNHYAGGPVRCIHNPATGREKELGIKTIALTRKPKVIAIVGGGVAGMEIARIAASRGHEVHLFEKEKHLGGQLQLAGRIPYRQGMLEIVKYLEKQIRRSRVHIHLGEEVSFDSLLQMESEVDINVFATGAKPYIPQSYQNIDRGNSLTISDVFVNSHKLGERILIVDADWRQNSLGLAEWLQQQGKIVTIISSAYVVGEMLDVATMTSYYSRLMGNITFIPLHDLDSYIDKIARIRNVLNNNIHELSSIDQVVFVTGSQPLNDLYTKAAHKLKEVYQVGDCVFPAGIPEAMLAANRLARIF